MDCSMFMFLVLLLFTPKTKAQQSYLEDSASDCGENVGTSPAFLYSCNRKKQSCKAFLIFLSQPPYDSVSAISNLTASDPSELARINDVSDHTLLLPPNKEVIVPVVCSCSDQSYEAKASFVIPSIDHTYYIIATQTYQSLSTCNALMQQNNYSAFHLLPGMKLKVPLRCACPTSNQTADGTKFLMTYLVSLDDSVPDVSKRFNVSVNSVAHANRFTEDDPPLLAFTPILIPLSAEPSSSQTVIHHLPGPPPFLSPPVTSIHGNRRSKDILIGVGIGIGIGILLLVLCLVISVVFFRCQKKGSQKNTEGKKKRALEEDLFVTISQVDVGLKVFEYGELKHATEDFSEKSWLGGSVHKGFLNGKALAIKKMSKDVTKEVNLLKKVNHFNLISLLGACEHGGDLYLMYEFMENGSLRDWIKKNNCPEVQSWDRRVQIALDIANGLHYLHNFTSPAYVHKDLCSTNVLLNKNLRAKIAGNSSIRYARVPNGYMAPEYIEYGLVTPAIDIYAFGVVMLELVTGKEAVFLQDGVEVLLSDTISTTMGGENAEAQPDGLIDPNFNVEHCAEFAVRMIKLSLECLAQEPENRPRIHQVLSFLQKIQFDATKVDSFL